MTRDEILRSLFSACHLVSGNGDAITGRGRGGRRVSAEVAARGTKAVRGAA